MNRRHSSRPEIGLVRVGDVTASSPSSFAIERMRSAWNGSETSTTCFSPRCRSTRAAADSDSQDV